MTMATAMTGHHGVSSTRLTFAVLSAAPSIPNPIGDRQVYLRVTPYTEQHHPTTYRLFNNPLHISTELGVERVENLAVLKDSNDTIDLTGNRLSRLENFPPMNRLTTLLLANNIISYMDPTLPDQLPNLACMILTGNRFRSLADIAPIAGWTTLNHLSLVGNPVAAKPYYREFIIHKCPSVRVFDFQRVLEKERIAAAKLFSGEEGTTLLASLMQAETASSAKTFIPGEMLLLSGAMKSRAKVGLDPAEIAKIKEAIASASSLEEVRRLEAVLKSGLSL